LLVVLNFWSIPLHHPAIISKHGSSPFALVSDEVRKFFLRDLMWFIRGYIQEKFWIS
jgi:hypothetical protein